jgi:hypothetical protein
MAMIRKEQVWDIGGRDMQTQTISITELFQPGA